MELLKVVSQILELYFVILFHFSQDYDPPPHIPRFDITQVINIHINMKTMGGKDILLLSLIRFSVQM